MNNVYHVEYKTYYNIKSRCYNENLKDYKYYGGKGIVMCDRWLESFENFLKDMGKRPSDNHSIERIDLNKNYGPNNCIWIENKFQHRNQSKRSDNTSGTTGVYKEKITRKGKDYFYWIATWYSLCGKSQKKLFSYLKHGDKGAYKLACEYRESAIKQLNANGAMYHDNHGK